MTIKLVTKNELNIKDPQHSTMMGTYSTLACRREVVQDAIDLCITQAPLNNRNFSLRLDCYERDF
jgi:hypothetical protein